MFLSLISDEALRSKCPPRDLVDLQVHQISEKAQRLYNQEAPTEIPPRDTRVRALSYDSCPPMRLRS